MNAVGCPILGDRMYGSKKRYRVRGAVGESIALFASRLEWNEFDGTLRQYQLIPPWR